MKIYEKPILMVLSVSANDALCSCGLKTRGNNEINTVMAILGVVDADGDGALEENEFPQGSFGDSESQCTAFQVTGYCKFSGAESYKLFTS